MKYLILALCLAGCGFNPSEGDWIPGDFEHRRKTCYDTTRVIGADSTETHVTPRACRGNNW